MNGLANVIRKLLPGIIHEYNTFRLPKIEEALGRSIIEEFSDETTRTSETTKIITRVLDNTFFRHIHRELPTFVEYEGKGRDYKFGDIPIEKKNTFGKGNSWTGNGFAKTGWHLLNKFSVNENGRITHAFLALVNLDECKGCWSEKTTKSNFSSLYLKNEDYDKIIVIYGSLQKNITNLTPMLHQVAFEQSPETPD